MNLRIALIKATRPLLPQDFDGNGVVDVADFLLFVKVFGSSGNLAGRTDDNNIPLSRYDLDNNNKINIADFLIFIEGFK